MTSPIPPSLERFGAELDRAAHRELSRAPSRARARDRSARGRVLAGGALGLVSAAAAVAVLLGSTAATPPAFAVTRNHDGSVSVVINRMSGIAGANRRLATMGIHERAVAVGDARSVASHCTAGSVPTVTIDVPGTPATRSSHAARHPDLRGAIRTSGRVAVAVCRTSAAPSRHAGGAAGT